MEEPFVSEYDVIVKEVASEWVIACSEELAEVSEMPTAHSQLWPRLHAVLEEHDVAFRPPSIALEEGVDPIRLTAALRVPDGFKFEDGEVETMELPGLERVAATVINGDPDFAEGFQALKRSRDAGEIELGNYRELCLNCDGPKETWVVELQIGLKESLLTRELRQETGCRVPVIGDAAHTIGEAEFAS
jgi:hypothetical protein